MKDLVTIPRRTFPGARLSAPGGGAETFGAVLSSATDGSSQVSNVISFHPTFTVISTKPSKTIAHHLDKR